ncbi:sulfatase-like hydrolase/transferase [Humisphaera borealis]|uniref:sulfatase-like hydrolase/transferase n=1 Tax=Humisphaera borealis TaxID=2807512 RepID=UPI0019D12B41|nr:sulfatase-like hydrolase/transferase [Humisphaera borealis]
MRIPLLPGCLFVLLWAGRALAAEAARPNFLFIYTDDQRYDAMSVVQKELGEAGRFPWLNTPNHDRLAAGGIRFRNAFVVNSLCSPSRANFLTGRYSHLNGVANNHTPFPVDSVTWSTELRKAGYITGYFGKWHMGPQSGQRPGFDFSASFVGQGKYFDCPIEVNGKSTPSQGWVDDVTTDYASTFIRENMARPFAAVIGFKSSHGPWQPPGRRKDDLAGAVAKPPQNANAKPPYLQNSTEPAAPGDSDDAAAPKKNAARKQGNAGAVSGDRSAMQQNYFRTLLGVDDNLGKLLDLLDELKLTDNTVVVYSSDNGYYLGDHGLGDKRSAYDESLRIPFIVRYPKLAKAGTTRDEMVINIDLAPTFLDLAGVPIPPQMQGRSLRPLLAGEMTPDWRKAWFYEYFYERGYSIPTILAVRTDTHKIIKYPGHDDWTELFDLKADPYERRTSTTTPPRPTCASRWKASSRSSRRRSISRFRTTPTIRRRKRLLPRHPRPLPGLRPDPPRPTVTC